MATGARLGCHYYRGGRRIHLPARGNARAVAQLAGTVILYGSWLANIHYINQFNEQAEQGMALESMLVFSLPFQLATVVVMCVLAIQLKRALSNPQDGFPR
jgi:hypothetical protein